MILKNLFIGTMAILTQLAIQAQTYNSPQQKTTSGGFANGVETKSIKKIVIGENKFYAELPDGGEIRGTIELFRKIERDQEKRTVYTISGGGLLSIIEDTDNNYDHIF